MDNDTYILMGGRGIKKTNPHRTLNALKLYEENQKLKKALTEIKEIIHFNKTNRLSGGACISIEQILQIISEVEG